jgi:hypothetical protein
MGLGAFFAPPSGPSGRRRKKPGYPLQFLPLRDKNSASIPCAGQTAAQFDLAEFCFAKLQGIQPASMPFLSFRFLLCKNLEIKTAGLHAGCFVELRAWIRGTHK